MVVVDTNILAYLLISGDRTDLARALAKRDPDWKSDAFALIEFSNILAMVGAALFGLADPGPLRV